MTTTIFRTRPAPLFELGAIVTTPGAGQALAPWQFRLYLDRHQAGDWGHVCEDDKALNDLAVKDGSRILSAYAIDTALPCKGFGENCVWVITEADRSVTTFLLPEEY
jgi:hypothetical protein